MWRRCMERPAFTITLAPNVVARRLAFVLVLLVLANIAVAVAYFFLGHQTLLGLTDEFSFNHENNLPTYFSGIMLLFASVLLAVIAQSKKQERMQRHWQGLAIIFLLMSVDEIASLHEEVGIIAARIAGVTGVAQLYFWVVPMFPLLVVLALSYGRFVARLPPRHRRRFVTAGGLYVCGAFGFEVISAWHATRYGYLSFSHAMIFTIEETLEMSGALLFIYALLHYMNDHVPRIRVEFEERREETARRAAAQV